MPRTLLEVTTGETVLITAIRPGAGALRQRLMDMGVTKGARVEIGRVAPLGDPVEIRVRGSRLALRKAEAACVEVE